VLRPLDVGEGDVCPFYDGQGDEVCDALFSIMDADQPASLSYTLGSDADPRTGHPACAEEGQNLG
jgi:hypothetical protein